MEVLAIPAVDLAAVRLIQREVDQLTLAVVEVLIQIVRAVDRRDRNVLEAIAADLIIQIDLEAAHLVQAAREVIAAVLAVVAVHAVTARAQDPAQIKKTYDFVALKMIQ